MTMNVNTDGCTVAAATLFSNPELSRRDIEIAMLMLEQRLDTGDVIQQELVPVEYLGFPELPARPTRVQNWGSVESDDAEPRTVDYYRRVLRIG